MSALMAVITPSAVRRFLNMGIAAPYDTAAHADPALQR
jgi:hypothetical protein